MTKTLIAAITVALMTTAAHAVEGEVPLHDR
jgi:hypothetical protein